MNSNFTKNLFLALIFLFVTTISFAQPFGANGATWTFSLISAWPPVTDSPVTVTSSAPYLFNGDTCRTISINSGGMGLGCWIDSSFIVKESNDSVYYWLPTSNRFVMLYNYNAAVGDTQTIYGRDIMNGDTSMQVVVTATGTININGVTKRTYYKDPIMPYYFNFEGTTIEDIGNVSFFLFPQWAFCDPVMWYLRCYEDSIVGLYNRTNPYIPCDTVIYVGMNELGGNHIISVSPNPFSSQISITFKNKNSSQNEFTIRNMFGQIVFKEHDSNPGVNYVKTINLSSIPKGVYLLDGNVDGARFVKKIVKD